MIREAVSTGLLVVATAAVWCLPITLALIVAGWERGRRRVVRRLRVERNWYRDYADMCRRAVATRPVTEAEQAVAELRAELDSWGGEPR